MSTALPHLLSPLQIGRATLRNRIVSAGHDTTLPTDGTVNDALFAYQEARAKGGVGMIIVQVAGIHESARYTSHLLMATTDDCIPGYRRLAAMCHEHDTVVVGQIFHPGREIMESSDGRAPVAYSSSDVPSERFHVTPRPLDQAGIDLMVQGYADAARRLGEAGMDGVEVVASHGYLPAQFLNPRVNLRDDAYGEDKVRFLREVLVATRAASGNRIVGLRMSVDELSWDGLEPTEALAAIKELSDLGLIDYINLVAGTSASNAGSIHIVPPMAIENGYTIPLAEQVRTVTGVPLILGGRFNEPTQAERAIANGSADACTMTRALICDPEMPNKAVAGQLERIRACIACNQACIGHFHLGYSISCIQHPETGRELTFGTIARTSAPKRVLIAGAGPAGMKAAAIAAERGHDVQLHEAAARVGGQVLLAERIPGRGEFGGAATNLHKEVEAAGARLVLDSRVDRALVEREQPDVVILATGGRPRRLPVEVMGEPTILDAWEVLEGAELPSGHLLIADWRCDWVGPGLAIKAAEAGRRVTLAVNGYHPGFRIQQYVRDELLGRLHRLHVEIIPTVRLYGIDDDTVYLQHTMSGEPIVLEGIGGVILAHGQEADDVLGAELGGLDVQLVRIGDCVAPRTVEEAVLEGLEAAVAI